MNNPQDNNPYRGGSKGSGVPEGEPFNPGTHPNQQQYPTAQGSSHTPGNPTTPANPTTPGNLNDPQSSPNPQGTGHSPYEPYSGSPRNPGSGQGQWGTPFGGFTPNSTSTYGATPGSMGTPGSPLGAPGPGAPGNPFHAYGMPPGTPGMPPGNNFGNAYSQPPKKSGGAGPVLLIIGLLVVIALAAGGYFLLARDEEDREASSSSSTPRSSSSTGDEANPSNGDEPSRNSGGAVTSPKPDSSLPARFQNALPTGLDDLLFACSDKSFNLQYEDGSTPSRTMEGTVCLGARESAWAFSSIDFIDDSEYTQSAIERVRNARSQEIISDEPGNFAAMEGILPGALRTLVIANAEQGVVMEAEYILGGEETMREILQKLGYAA